MSEFEFNQAAYSAEVEEIIRQAPADAEGVSFGYDHEKKSAVGLYRGYLHVYPDGTVKPVVIVRAYEAAERLKEMQVEENTTDPATVENHGEGHVCDIIVDENDGSIEIRYKVDKIGCAISMAENLVEELKRMEAAGEV